MTEASKLTLHQQAVNGWEIPTVEFADPTRNSLCLTIPGTIVNSITERKESLQTWKVEIASKVKEARGASLWIPSSDYAITLALSFHPANHGYQPLDVENFIKPILDALAAGLFCDPQTAPSNISHWNYDDSNFNTLLIHRLSDAASRDAEGVAICVSTLPV